MVPLREVLTPAGEPHRVEPGRAYRIAGVFGFGRGVICRPPVTGAEMAADRLYRVRSRQIVYSRLKSFEGAFAIVPDEADGFFVSNEFPSFDADEKRADYRYLGWYLRRPATWLALSGEGRGIGARRERLHPEEFLAHQLPLPPLDEQRRIVERLDAVEARIAQRQSEVDALDKELARLLAAAFHRIAQDAPRARMGDVAPLVRRSVMIDPEASYTEIGVRSFFKGAFHRRTVSGAEFTWQKLFRVNDGDLIFSNLMAWEKGIALAGAADDGCVGNHRMLTCEADRGRLVPGFLWFYFTTEEGFAQVVAASPGTIARNKTLSAEELPNITVPVPSLDAQRWFDALQQKARAAREAQAAAAAELDHLVPALLAEAFGSG